MLCHEAAEEEYFDTQAESRLADLNWAEVVAWPILEQ